MASDWPWTDCRSRTNALLRRLNGLRTSSACAPSLRSRPSRLQLALSTRSVKQAVMKSLRAVSGAPVARSSSSRRLLGGRFGYSDLKEAALRGGTYVFSIGLQRVVWMAGLVLRAGWVDCDRGLTPICVVLRQLPMVVEVVLLSDGLDETQRQCTWRSMWRDRGWSCGLMRQISG
jgi:hypothetical protein